LPEVAGADLAPVPPPALVVNVAPHNPDYERNRALLEDDELAISMGEQIEHLARGYGFEDLLRQVCAYLRERERRGLGPGALVQRLKAHLADPGDWRAGPLTRADRASALYRRHCVLVAPEPEPEPEPDPEPADFRRLLVNAPTPGELLWQTCQATLRLQLPQSTYDAWVRDTQAELAGDVLTICAPTDAAREGLQRRLAVRIGETVQRAAGRDLALVFATAGGP
jgi:hypothetical protein